MATATQRKNVGLQLGGFAVTVNVESALEGTKEVSLNNLCCGTVAAEHGPAQTRQQLKCPVCDNADKDSFKKGRDMGAGRFVVVPEDVLELAGAEGSKSSSIELQAHPRDQVGRSLNGDKCYFLVPANAASAESYALVAAAIASRPDLSFVTKWAVRSANAMYQVDVLDGRLVMKQLAWPGSVRALPEVPTSFNDKFMAVAATLIDTMVTDYNPAEYVDSKSAVITEYLEAADTIAGAEVDDTGTITTSGTVDLEGALMAALAAATDGKAPVQAMPAEQPGNVARLGAATAKKPAAKKPAATKTTAKKTAAKKTVAAAS